MEDEYESLPESSGLYAHMVAGACAGVMEHCVMYPVDSVKVRRRHGGQGGAYHVLSLFVY